MHMGWLDVGFLILFGLALKWDLVRATNNLAANLADRLTAIEITQERIDEKLRMISSDTTRAAEALGRKEETIEEEWLLENYHPPG